MIINTETINNLSPEQIGKIFPIEVVPFREEWKTLFYREKKLIVSTLCSLFKIDVEHIGSTAIQGLSAKPIVDILIEIPSINNETKIEILSKLRKIGYENMSNAEQEKRMTFGKGYDFLNPDKQKFHLHVREKNNDFQDEIYFRNYLKQNLDARKEYEELKINLAKEHKNNRENYTFAKTDFIMKITEMAKTTNISL